MKINWKVRVLSIKFWLALVPAVLLLAQAVAAPFGYKWDFANLGTQLTGIVNAVFAVLSILGVVTDPTTAGLSDSVQAQTYGTILGDAKADKLAAQRVQDDQEDGAYAGEFDGQQGQTADLTDVSAEYKQAYVKANIKALTERQAGIDAKAAEIKAVADAIIAQQKADKEAKK